MDYGYKFEKLINNYIGTPDMVTYSNYWANKNKRASLLFTVCIKEYDKNSTGKIGIKLEYFMTELFNDNNEDKKISIECLNFLSGLK
ncbi:MAG: hypothetical protein QM486_01180 [Flavobacteriaceae bacterium]